MDDILLARSRDRLRRLRTVADMAHDPQMIATVTKIADELEADLEKLEAERGTTIIHLEPPLT